LSAAKRVLDSRECSRTAFAVEGLPDSVRGAYVFRNGFVEALAHHGLARNSAQSAEPCRYKWTGKGLEKVP
jgi:hypothetical protein